MKRRHFTTAATARFFLHAFLAVAALVPFTATRAGQPAPATAAAALASTIPADLNAKNVVVGDRLVLGGSIVEVAASPAAAKPRQAVILRANLADEELDTPLVFEVTLTMRDLDVLRERTARNNRLTRAELDANHLPAQADFDALAKWLTDQGFTIKKRDGHRLALFASGSIRQVQNAFGTHFAAVTFEGKTHLSAVTAPSVPVSLHGVLGVTGLQPFIHAYFSSQPAPRVGPVTHTNNQPPYLVSEILHAFSADTTSLTGEGQEIGIIINALPPYDDLTAFWQYNNINHTGEVDDENVNVTGNSDPTLFEAELDVEWSTGIAPGADETVFVTGTLAQADTDSAYSTIGNELADGDHPELNTISMSYYEPEDGVSDSYLTSEQQYFATIASYGVTIFVCSGDNGAFDTKGNLSASYPTSDPSVTGVGGVSIVLNPSTGAVSSEIGWTADAKGFNDGRIAASGGGVSRLPRPSWQQGDGVPSGSTRLVPDVAASSDQNEPGITVNTDPKTGDQNVGGGANGTSWATPTWGGLMALINEGRDNAGLDPVGVLGPKIYPLIGTSNFRDITEGNNGHYNKGDGYFCGTGYDLVTGIGTPIFSNLLANLTALPPTITSFSPTSGPVGSTVVIKGTGFVAPLEADFGGDVPAAGSFSSTELTVTVPSGAETGKITLYTNAGSVTSAGTFTVTASAAKPVITSATSATATQGKAFSYQITASNKPTSYAAPGLPSGLSINTTTGLISGTPKNVGKAAVTISATNAAGTGTGRVTITIQAVPVITSATTATATVNKAFSYQITASNEPTSYAAKGLPTGLSINTTTGLISGTPKNVGKAAVTISAINAAGTGTGKVTITIASASAGPAITSATSASATVGTAFTYQITATGSPTSFAAPGLPTGLSINTTTGKITGTPKDAGTAAVTISATNASGTGSAKLTITIKAD